MVLRVLIALLFFTGAAHAEPLTASEIHVKDGDTIKVRGESYRLIGFDTPELQSRRRKVSADERAVAGLAKERLIELLASGDIDLTEARCACSDRQIGTRYCNNGRKCAVLSVNGKNVGATLIAEELAVPFVCGKTRCPKMPDWPRIIENYNR